MLKPELRISETVDRYLNRPLHSNAFVQLFQWLLWAAAVWVVITACLAVGLFGCIVEAGQTVRERIWR